MQTLLEKLVEKNRYWTSKGTLPSRMPVLQRVSPDILGVTVVTYSGEEYSAGEFDIRFTMQSVSKSIALMLALLDRGKNYVINRVGTEVTSEPLNPMTNGGAMVVTSMIKGRDVEER